MTAVFCNVCSRYKPAHRLLFMQLSMSFMQFDWCGQYEYFISFYVRCCGHVLLL